MFKKEITFLLLLISPFILFSQSNYNTCENAYELCSKGAFVFNFDALETLPEKEPLACLEQYENILWVKWKIKEKGYLTFSLFPIGHVWGDIDFAVYKVRANGNCKRKKLLRCMTSGLNSPNGNDVDESSYPCAGEMGLSIAEPNNQTHEDPGCSPGDNNFLAALQCEEGEEYLLAIVQFDRVKTGYVLDICGSAQLPCDTVFCQEYTTRSADLPNKKIVSFANQIDGNKLPIFIKGFKKQTIQAIIENKNGDYSDKHILEIAEGENTYNLPVGDLLHGEYFLKLELKKQRVEGVFMKN